MDGEFQHSNSSTRFADQLHGLLGDDSDLDPVFLEESWTLGVPAAMHRRQERRQSQSEREHQAREFRELNSLGTLAFVDAGEWLGGFHLAAQIGSQMAAARESPAHPADPHHKTATARPIQATHLTPEQDACRLLGVNPTSTREQLRAAYRRMVIAWHPDRIERGSDTLRQQATERMATINEAYRLLRNNLSPEPA